MAPLKNGVQALLVSGSSLVLALLAAPAHAETVCAQAPGSGLTTALDCTDGGAATASGTLTAGALVAGPGVKTDFTGTLNGTLAGPVSTIGTALSLNATDTITFVHSGRIETTADSAFGADAVSEAKDVVLTVGDVVTRGKDAIGISAGGNLNTKITCGSVTTTGAGATGIQAYQSEYLGGGVSVTCGNVSATGAGARGVSIGASFGGKVSLGTIRSDGTALSIRTDEGGYTVKVGNITTTGENGQGISANGRDGYIDITCGSITTSGKDADGISTFASDGSVGVQCGDITTSGQGAYGAILGGGGGTLGNITTTGDGASGVYAGYFYGSSVKATSVSTSGKNSSGVFLDLTGSATLEVGDIHTRGENSNGISGGYGDYSGATIKADAITTEGANAIGIAMQNNSTTSFNTTAGPITTSGATAHGIVIEDRAFFDPDIVKLRLSGVAVSGAGADGIRIGVNQLDDPSTLAVDLVTTGSITSADGTAIHIVTTEALPFTLAEGLDVSGRTGGIIAKAGSATFAIAGTVRAAAGPAIEVTGGPATVDIAATGRIEGALVFGDGNDTVTNAGVFAAAGNSTFGGGSDLFVNTGRLTVAGAAPVTLAALETFRNAGTIDMANGFAGNRLEIGGAFEGQTGSRVLLDVSHSLDKADVLAITGPVTGQTTVVVTFVPSTEPVSTNGIKLIEGASASADKFTIEGLDAFDLFTLAVTARGNDLFIAPALDPRATDLGVLAAAAPDMWLQSFDAVRAAIAGRGTFLPRLGLWSQAYGGHDRSGKTGTVQALGASLSASSRLDLDRYGAQMGFDASAGRVLVGVTGGYERARGNAGLASRLTSDGWNIGAYAGVGSRLGGYATVTVKHDWLKLDFAIPGTAFSIPRLSARALGADIEAGWRLSAGPLSLDLGGGASIVRAKLDPFSAGAATLVNPGSTTTARLRAGGRIAFSASVSPYIDLRGFHTFAPSGALALTGGAAALQLDTPGRGSWLRAEAGLGALSKRLSLAVWAEAGDRSGWGLRAGFTF